MVRQAWYAVDRKWHRYRGVSIVHNIMHIFRAKLIFGGGNFRVRNVFTEMTIPAWMIILWMFSPYQFRPLITHTIRLLPSMMYCISLICERPSAGLKM